MRSLETKTILVLVLVLSVVLGIYALLDLYFEHSKTYQLQYKQLDVLTNTIQKSLIKDMRSGSGSDVQEILEMVGTEPGIISVRIFDKDGRILKSDRRREVGQAVPDIILHSYRDGVRDFTTEENGSDVIHILHPVANAPQCTPCHPNAGEIIGVLSLAYSLDLAGDYISAHSRRLAALMGVTILVAALALFLLLKRMVNDPIVRLKGAMAQAEQGNLDISIEVSSADEIGSLQASFNSMLARIKELNLRNLAQREAIIRNEEELRVKDTLAEKNMELEAANREAVEKNRYYMEMLSFISHELKSPLVVLKGYSTLLTGGDLGEFKGPQLEAVRAMDRSVDTLNEMIANYLDLSMLERGELTLHKRRLSLVEEIIKPLMLEYSELIDRASMSLRIDCPADIQDITADPALMKSVVGNLLSNAVKYGRPGTDIIVEAARRGEDIQLSVSNEGMGIPSANLETVFDRFSRLDNDVTRSQKGTGLGLYLVKVIVQLHGGSVAAESKEGEWVRIVLNLPEKPKEPQEDV